MDGAASTKACEEEFDAIDLDSSVVAAPAMRAPGEEVYVDLLVRASLQLLGKGLPPEIEYHGLEMMEHLFRFRWVELRMAEWSVFGGVADLVDGLAAPLDLLPSRSATGALVAKVIWSRGVSLLKDVLPSITSLSKSGPVEAELAAFILKGISDFWIGCTVDLQGEQCAVDFRDQDELLTNIMFLLSSLLEEHVKPILAEHPDELMVSTEKNVLTVTTGLVAANAYAGWVPVVLLAKHGLIERCGSLLHLSKFQIYALQFFDILCQRRRPLTAAKDYDDAMGNVFEIVMSISQDSLTKFRSGSDFVSESEVDIAERICDCLVALGSFNMQCIIGDTIKTSRFLRQMLEYYEHNKIAFHFRCLPIWLIVLSELPKEKIIASNPGDIASASGANSTEKGSTGALFFVSDDICSVILDVSFKRMLKTSATILPNSLELWSDELHGKNDFIQYRSRLLDLVKYVAYRRPVLAASKAAQRVNRVTGDASTLAKTSKDPSTVQSARLQICSCFIRICKAVDSTALPSDIKELFSAYITEDVLAFGALEKATYSVEQNEGGDETQDRHTIHLFASSQISDQIARLQHWALKERRLSHVNEKLQPCVTYVKQVVNDVEKPGVEGHAINKFDGGCQGHDQ